MSRRKKAHKIRVKQIGRLHYQVSSQSNRRTRYIVDLEPQKDAGPDPRKAFCSCPAYNFNPGVYCKHIVAVVEFLKSQPKQ